MGIFLDRPACGLSGQMGRAAELGSPHVVMPLGEAGPCLLWNGRFASRPARRACVGVSRTGDQGRGSPAPPESLQAWRGLLGECEPTQGRAPCHRGPLGWHVWRHEGSGGALRVGRQETLRVTPGGACGSVVATVAPRARFHTGVLCVGPKPALPRNAEALGVAEPTPQKESEQDTPGLWGSGS